MQGQNIKKYLCVHMGLSTMYVTIPSPCRWDCLYIKMEHTDKSSLFHINFAKINWIYIMMD